MRVFNAYARFYDLLYRDKDYREEAGYVHKLIQRHAPRAHTILELGSGTGAHAAILAELGYDLEGVELSDEMLAQAIERQARMPAEIAPRLTFNLGDARSARLHRSFDAVISLFHVASYMTSNTDLVEYLANAARHLRSGGVFIFDFWFGPAVLTDRPAVRVKRLEDENTRVVRVSEPVMDPLTNTVNVKFTVFVQDKGSGFYDELHETHCMRYLFLPELDCLLGQAGLQLVRGLEWRSLDREPSFESWYAVAVAVKPESEDQAAGDLTSG